MNSKLPLIIAGATLAVTSFALPASAYKSHEHVFYRSSRIRRLSQSEGNGFCRNKFRQLRATGDLGGGFNPRKVKHVWAHIRNGHCVANT